MTASWTVHIIDDDEPCRVSLSFALQALGWRTHCYAGPEDFLSRDREARELVLSDIRMPGMDGIELARRLRQESARTRIILMTGHADPGLVNVSILAGADRVLEKPVELAVLLAEIQRLTAD